MLGDGAAIDPTSNELCAPCDGEVISIAATFHAVALRATCGAEILVHVGIDTVTLGGQGFMLLVRKGDRVRAGDVLLRFDLDQVARKARSLLTPVIVTNGDHFHIRHRQLDRRLAAGDVLFEIEKIGIESGAVGQGAAAASAAAPVVSEALVVRHAHGIHARPAALIARVAKTLPYELEVRARGRSADPRSAVALMSLGVRGGDEIVIAGFEAAAATGIAEIAAAVRALEAAPAQPAAGGTPAAPASVAPVPARPAQSKQGQLRGVIASRGFALGTAARFEIDALEVVEAGAGVAAEQAALEGALSAVRAELGQHLRTAPMALREILEAHLELLDDPLLMGQARTRIAAGKSAGFAWRAAIEAGIRELNETGDARLMERAGDFRDLERQVLRKFAGGTELRHALPPDSILLARDLTPSQFIDIDVAKIAGIALVAGGPTSHVAILAASFGIPMLVSLGAGLQSIAEGARLILDAESGALDTSPGQAELGHARARLENERGQKARELEAAKQDCRLAGGQRIEVFANLSGTAADARQAVAQGAEGCGLLRTEFLFLDRASAPDEAEQRASYQQVADLLGTRPLVIRTMDIGGDKPIAYLPLPPEDNPALGLRGVRTSLWRPDLFDAQLRALLGVRPAVRILLPMITDAAEFELVRARVDDLCRAAGVPRPQLGAMIETPAAAMLADQLARVADFLSIGTNDLAQYTLAMDRGHAGLAARIDGVHPAVLRLIDTTARGAAAHGRPLAVCGGLASYPEAIPLLLGLGVTELSVVPGSIPRLKALVRTLALEDCRVLARRALELSTAAEVRALCTKETP